MFPYFPPPDAAPVPAQAFPRPLGVGGEAVPPPARVPNPDHSREAENTRRKHILVVDDDVWIQEILCHVLHRHGYEATCYGAAEEALEALSRRSFDLVISDMMLAGLSGLELTARLAKLRPNLPVILITGQADTEVMRSALRCGACDFIPKPFSTEAIPLVVERALERCDLDRRRIARHVEASSDALVLSSVQMLATAMDAREPYTAQHSRRVAAIAVALAEKLGLPPSEVRLVAIAAEIHDVGKMGTPDSILNKPGPLTDDEWAQMKHHPVQGADIVARLPQLAYVADVVRHHHERMDGGGYPDGLRGEAIPFLSRIIAVADAYEVMTSDRVYRRRLDPGEPVRRLQESSGRQFDPSVVEALVNYPPCSLPLPQPHPPL